MVCTTRYELVKYQKILKSMTKTYELFMPVIERYKGRSMPKHIDIYWTLLAMQQDQFGRLLPTFIQVIDLTEQEEYEYWTAVSAVFDGRQVDSVTSRSSFESLNSTSMEASINNKVCMKTTLPF